MAMSTPTRGAMPCERKQRELTDELRQAAKIASLSLNASTTCCITARTAFELRSCLRMSDQISRFEGSGPTRIAGGSARAARCNAAGEPAPRRSERRRPEGHASDLLGDPVDADGAADAHRDDHARGQPPEADHRRGAASRVKRAGPATVKAIPGPHGGEARVSCTPAGTIRFELRFAG